MATYYLRTTANGGSDGAAGTSVGAAWATFGKALGASGMASGDTLIVGGGTYREAVTVAMTSATVETIIRHDYDNLTGDGPEVIWTAYTTNDTTTPSTSPTLNLSGRDFLTFQGITFVGANQSAGSCVRGSTATPLNIVFRDCAFLPGATSSTLINVSSAANTALNWTIERCAFLNPNGNGCFEATLLTHTSDYDVNVLVRNCLFLAAACTPIRITASGAGAGHGGGVDVVGCTYVGGSSFMSTGSASLSDTTYPCTAEGCLIVCNSAAFNANLSGQIVEDRNRVLSNTANTNTSNGSNSQYGVTHAMLVNLGQESFWSMYPRPMLAPLVGSPLLGFGNPTGAATVDFLSRPRPAGGPTTHAAGAFERHDTGRIGASLGADSGGYVEIVGPGDHDLLIPVSASATVVTVKVKWDSTHADTNKPRATILNGGQVGWPDETKTATGTAGSAYETLTFTTRTPSAAGVITLRLISRSAGATGIAAFDTVAIS